MIVSLAIDVDAVVVKTRARKEIPVDLVVRRNFVIRDVSLDAAPFATRSGTRENPLGMRFDWHSFEDSFWRIQDEHQELHLSRAVDDRIEALRSFGRPRGEKNRTLERVSEDDVKEIVSCNADEIAALAAEWLDENYVAIDGRIARRDDVPVLTNKAMASMFNRVEAGYDGLPDVFPICLWDLDADVLRSFVKPYKTNDKIAAAAAAYEPVAAPEFDRFRELASHHARGLIDISSHHQTVSARHRAACAIVRDALDRRVSGHEIMMLVGRIFPKEVDKPEYAKLLERFGPPKKTRYALAEAGDGARLMFGMGQTKDGAVAETRIPRMDPADAPVVATLAARTGPAFELRRSGDEWIVPVLSDGKVGSALVRALGADADPWKETDVSRQYDLGSLQQTAAALGLIGSAVDAESRAEELVAFAANHLVEIAGIVHMRGGEPFLVQRSDRVEIRMSAPGKLDQAVKAAAAKSISYNENANVFGIPEAGLMETVALTGSYPPEGGPILTRCSVPEPGMFEVVGRHLAASVVFERAMAPTDRHEMPSRLRRLVDAAAVSASRARSFFPQAADTSTIEDLHDRLFDLVEEIQGRSIYARLTETVAFAALRDGVLPSLAAPVSGIDDDAVLSGLRM